MSITIRYTSTTNTPPSNLVELYSAIQNLIQELSYSVNENDIYRSMIRNIRSDSTEWVSIRGSTPHQNLELDLLGNEESIDKKRDDNILLSKTKSSRYKKECPVCYIEKRLKLGLFQCEHLLCAGCFTQMKKQICPICRADKTIY